MFGFRWGGATSPLPHGLVYEGISEKPIQVGKLFSYRKTMLVQIDKNCKHKNFGLKMLRSI